MGEKPKKPTESSALEGFIRKESHSLLTAVTVTIIALILNKFVNVIDPWSVVGATVIVVLSIGTGTYISIYSAKDLILRVEARSVKENDFLGRLERCTNSVGVISQIAKGDFGKSIITYQELAQIEKDVEEDGEIWVLTSALELERDTGKEGLADIIQTNLDKNIGYTYFIPDKNPTLARNIKKLAIEWQKKSNLSKKVAQKLIKCYVVPDHFAYMTIVIYNAQNATKTNPPTVLVKFPLSDTYKKEDYPIIYRVDTDTEKAWKPFLDALMYFNVDKSKCEASHSLPINFEDIPEIEEDKK
jgi:hypothetical protein